MSDIPTTFYSPDTDTNDGTQSSLINEIVMRTNAPAVFCKDPVPSASDKYQVYNTWEVIQALGKKGWYPVEANQVQARSEARNNQVRHLVRFRNDELEKSLGVTGDIDDCVPELVLLNSHDRTTPFVIHGGVFRFVCSNGMIVSDEEFGSIKVRHIGHSLEEIIEATEVFAENITNLAGSIDEMKNITLNRKAQLEFAQTAQEIRYPNKEKKDMSFESDVLLWVRREADKEPTLWNTFNTLQENLLQGGVAFERSSGKHKTGFTREVKSIDQTLRINKELWQAARDLSKNFA